MALDLRDLILLVLGHSGGAVVGREKLWRSVMLLQGFSPDVRTYSIAIEEALRQLDDEGYIRIRDECSTPEQDNTVFVLTRKGADKYMELVASFYSRYYGGQGKGGD